MADTVAALQLSIMQEFFRIRMEEAYGSNWIDKVRGIVESKFDNDDKYKHNYQGIYNVLDKEGVENLNEKRMDITNLTSLILNDFLNECKVGSNFRQQIKNIEQCKVGPNFQQQIKNIRKDKNELVSHISDHDDLLNVKIMELTALKDVRSFLRYLSNSNWAYVGKQEYVDKYLKRIEDLTTQLFKDILGPDKKEIEFESTRVNYLNKLMAEREANAAEYLPLEYKVDDGTAQRYDLEELDMLPQNRRGFVLFADAGYGKTWSIQELAGACAERAFTEQGVAVTPILIKMGQLAAHDEPILKAVQEFLYPGDVNLEAARVFLQTKQVVLYIDGMDEADSSNKRNAKKEMDKFLEYENVRIIGGTREADKSVFPRDIKKYSICELTDKKVRGFITKLVKDEVKREKALHDYFDNPATNFLKNLRSPFYLKCYVDFVNEGEKDPESDTDMMERCLNKMIEREIELKGFRTTVELVNLFLLKLAEILGEKRYVDESQALDYVQGKLASIYDMKEMISFVQIKDTLVELQVLREEFRERQTPLIGFGHEKYKSFFSPTANDLESWNY